MYSLNAYLQIQNIYVFIYVPRPVYLYLETDTLAQMHLNMCCMDSVHMLISTVYT